MTTQLDKDCITRRCLKAMAESLAPILVTNAKSLGEDLFIIAQREGWALVPRVSINPPMDVAFSAWLIEIADTTWVTGVERFRPVADSIKADLSRMKVEAVRVEPQLDVCG